MTTTPAAPPPTESGRADNIKSGLLGIARAIWFVFQFAIFAMGMVFLFIGKALITLSGIDSRHTDDAPDKRPPPGVAPH